MCCFNYIKRVHPSKKRSMDEQFSNILKQSDGVQVYEDIKVSNPYICTATIVCKLSVDKINIQSLIDNNDDTSFKIRTTKSKRKIYRPFSNSITLIFQNKKTIKVFSNGTLHITGCTSINAAHLLVDELCDYLKKTTNNDDISIQDTRILTLNTTLKFFSADNLFIDLESARTTILNKYPDENKLMARYNPDIYQGLILKPLFEKTNRKISILCFYTGSFIITGVKCPDELQFGIEFLVEAFRKVFSVQKTM